MSCSDRSSCAAAGRIAAFQRLRVEDDAAAVIAQIVDDLTRADMSMDLAVFPECHLLGHSYDPATIAARAIDVEDDRWRAILAPLAPVATTVILGSFERRADGVTNSAFVIERGRVVSRYAKRNPNEPAWSRGAQARSSNGTACGTASTSATAPTIPTQHEVWPTRARG